MYYFASIASALSNVKPYFSQSEVTFHNDVGFVTIYGRIYCMAQIFDVIQLMIRRRVIFVSTLEFKIYVMTLRCIINDVTLQHNRAVT